MSWKQSVFLLCCIISTSKCFNYGPNENHFRISRSAKQSSDSEQCGETNLKPEHVVGKCGTFNGSACLCPLNGNCEYDASQNACVDVQDCAANDQNAVDCRNDHCIYDCATGVCSGRGSDESNCADSGSVVSVGSKCSAYCNDICRCKGSGCDYDSKSGKCSSAKNLACPESAFSLNECARIGGIYHKHGSYCRNMKPRGNCEIDKIILAVNLNGQNLTDSQGIDYMSGKLMPYDDKDKVLSTYRLAKEIPYVHQSDQELYRSGIYGNSTKRDSDRCVTYNVTICSEGHFQLVIKTVEIQDVLPGEKLFNVRFGDRLIFPEVDIVQLAGEDKNHVDLVLNFEVRDKMIRIPGCGDMRMNERFVPLSFCFSKCTFTEGFFQVGAFSVSKLHQENNKNEDDCGKYHNNDWECEMANCVYNKHDRTCLSYYSENTCKPTASACGHFEQVNRKVYKETCPIKYDEARIQMHITMDISGGPDYHNDRVVHKMGKKIHELQTALNSIHPDTQFSFSVHNNYPSDCYNYNGDSRSSTDPEGCYTHLVPFTSDANVIANAAAGVVGKFGVYGIAHEASLPGVAFATVDRSNKWNRNRFDENGKRLFNFVVLVSDDNSMMDLDHPGNRTHFRFDGTDNCQTTRIPTYEVYNDIFTRYTTNVIGLLHWYVSPYEDHFKQIGTPFCGRNFGGENGFESNFVDIIVTCVKEMTECQCVD